MKTLTFFITSILMLSFGLAKAQPSRPENGIADGNLMSEINKESITNSFIVNINPMDEERKEKLNRVAANYRTRNRSILLDIGAAMLKGGATAIANVIKTDNFNPIQVRSRQRKTWQEMRQKECTFTDSLQSVKGQCDFYSRQSNFGPLDPSDMNFDGITLCANKDGQEVLRMVCHIDTARFDHLFLHSKFYLVVDSISFNPYHSFLPNMNANRIKQPQKNASQDVIDYWNAINLYNFEDQQGLNINIKIDLSSSWINELVQVYQDVKLGEFSVNIPIKENELKDSVYIYSRNKAIAENLPIIDMEGDCFVVPRSYMPVSANNPSWGTGEYKMKVVLTEKCRYNQKKGRSENWHRDYKQLVQLQNQGNKKNEYVSEIITTFRDNKNTILKATYTPAIEKASTLLGIGTSSGATGAKPNAQNTQKKK